MIHPARRASKGRWLIASYLGTTLFLCSNAAKAVEPMMDSDLFMVTRLEASNLANDGLYLDALKTEEKAYVIAQAQWGPIHPSLAVIFKDKGLLYHTLGNFKKSEEEYKWGLALAEKNGGAENTSTADFLDRLGYLYLDMNRLEEAEIATKRSLDIRKNQANDDPQVLVKALVLFGRIEAKLQKYNPSRTALSRALELIEKNPPTTPALTIDLLGVLSRLDLSEQKVSSAQTRLEKALSLAQKSYPADSVETADAMVELADFFASQKQLDKAKPLYDSALQTDRHFVGTVYSFQSLPYLRRLAKVDFATGDFKNSEFLWKKAVQIEKDRLGARHPKAALDLVQQAEAESAMGQKAKAKEALQESLGILKDLFPTDNPWVQMVQKRLE